MTLRKLGCIFEKNEFSDFSTHAQVPTAIVLDQVIRVYYAARNERGKSFVTFVDLDRKDWKKIIYHHKAPIMNAGALGSFDEDGMMPSMAIQCDDGIRLYYTGWNQKISTPYHNATGVAISRDGGRSFTRMFDGPILERNHIEPYIAVTPCLLIENGRWHMWYSGGTRWVNVNGACESVYVIMTAESEDGISWRRSGRQVIPNQFQFETFSRPTVFRREDKLHMLFCSRGIEDYRGGAQGYRFGYAWSTDGLEWIRKDEVLNIGNSTGEWEDKMNCYPFHLQIDGDDNILYNGNGFGKTGFGLAKLEL